MKDDVRNAFEGLTEAPHPALRASLRARLATGPTRSPSPVYRLAAVAAVIAVVALAGYGAVRFLGARNPGTGLAGTPSSSPTPTASATPAPSPTPTFTAVTADPTTGIVLPRFDCADSSGGTQGATAEVTDVRVGTATGFDRFVIQLPVCLVVCLFVLFGPTRATATTTTSKQ